MLKRFNIAQANCQLQEAQAESQTGQSFYLSIVAVAVTSVTGASALVPLVSRAVL